MRPMFASASRFLGSSSRSVAESTGTLDVSLEDLAEMSDFDEEEEALPAARQAAPLGRLGRRGGSGGSGRILSLTDSVAEETLDLSASFGG